MPGTVRPSETVGQDPTDIGGNAFAIHSEIRVQIHQCKNRCSTVAWGGRTGTVERLESTG